jgi:hypothetical protein
MCENEEALALILCSGAMLIMCNLIKKRKKHVIIVLEIPRYTIIQLIIAKQILPKDLHVTPRIKDSWKNEAGLPEIRWYVLKTSTLKRRIPLCCSENRQITPIT